MQLSVVADVYNAFPKGPLPSALNEIIKELSSKKLIKIDTLKEELEQRL